MGQCAPALDVVGVCKSYGATVALADASIAIAAGEVHAILGENGAGKSTLVKVLSGVVAADSGVVKVKDRSLRGLRSVLDARKAGIATAFQELSLLPNLSVAANLVMPYLQRGRLGLASRRATEAAAAATLADFAIDDIEPSAPVGSLPLAQKQRLEITRALSHARNLLILDEPSASLPDTTWLFEQIRKAAARGVAVLYISHRLGEVRSLCSRATVLRNGRSIDSVDLAGIGDGEIFEMMVGRNPEELSQAGRRQSLVDEAVLEVESLNVGKVRDVSFQLRRGEVLGLSALEGQGHEDLLRSLVGLEPLDSGEIRVDGAVRKIGSPRDALGAGEGIAFVPEERKTEGIFPNMSAASNVTLPRSLRLSRFGFITGRKESKTASSVAAQLEFQERYLRFNIENLSGGNQQKVVIARALASGARTLLLFDPTRGVDVGTKQSIYRVIAEFAQAGGAVLLYSSEIPELVQLCDRCLVLYDGEILDVLSGGAISEQALISGIHGHIASSASAGKADR